MHLDPDTRRLRELRENGDQRRGGAWWIATIAAGVLLGNLLSFGAYQLYARWQLHALMASTDAMLRKQQERARADEARLATELAAQRKERDRQASIDAQLQQTCEFWRRETGRENTARNREYRDAACARAGRPLR